MQLREEGLRNQIALGWVMTLLVEVVMLLFMTIESILTDNNFFALRMDPGESIKWMVYLVAVKGLMPIYVNAVHGVKLRLLRWVAVVVAVLQFLFYLLHHLSHVQAGQRPDLSSHVLDLLMHMVGLWVIVSSIRWARFPKSEPA